MNEQMMRAFAYSNYTRFKCIGGKCEDTCCRTATWDISISPGVYLTYKSLTGEFAAELLDAVETKGDGYVMKGNAKKSCCMLGDDGLCRIHKNLGAKYLCDTCSIYPRISREFNHGIEMAYSMSCPEVARLILLQKDGIRFIEFEVLMVEGVLQCAGRSNLSQGICFDIRAAAVDILQNRGLTLERRLLYMSMLLRGLERIPLTDGYEDDMRKVLEMYKSNMYSGLTEEVEQRLGELDTKFRMGIYNAIIDLIRRMIKNDKDYLANGGFYSRLNDLYENIEELYSDDLNKQKNRLLHPYMAEKEYVFENYLVNRMFVDKFPFNYTNLDLACRSELLRFLFLQLFIAAIFRKSPALTDEDVINCIYYFERTTAHGAMFIQYLEELCEKTFDFGYAQLAYLLWRD